MASTVKLNISIDDNGDLKVIAKDAKKASTATDNLGKSTDKTTKSRSNFHKQEKGVAGATSNSTKAFSKQAQTIGGGSSGLVGAYATLAANVFALTAAFGVLSRNAGFKQLEQGIIFTGRAAGTNLPLVANNLKSITDAAISTADAMRAVAIGTSAGFDATQLEGLTRVAKGASLALGRDMTDALDRLVRGAAKLEPEILDELGIMVRLDETAEKFAGTIGKSAGELTTFEKRMAFTNAIIEQGERKFGNLNDAIEANPYSKLAATFDTLLKSSIGFVDKGLGPIVSLIASNVGILTGVIGIFAAGIVKMMVPALASGGKAAAEMAERTRDMAKSQLSSVQAFKGAPVVFKDLQKKMAAGTATAEDMTRAKKSLTQSIATHQRHIDADPAKYGASTAAGQQKIATIELEKQALAELAKVEALETKATMLSGRADVMHTASTGGLIATLKALQVQIAAEHAQLTAETAGTNAATAAKQRFALACGQAGLAVKALGTALINAIPMIGTIIFAVSMAVEAFKKLFIPPPTALEEQLKETKKALDEMPAIIDQMVDSYESAANSSERFETSLKVQVGLINTVVTQLKKQLAVQKTQLLQDRATAAARLMRAKIANPDEGDTDLKISHYGGMGRPIFMEAATETGKATKALKAANDATLDLQATTKAFTNTLVEAISHQEIFAMIQDEGSDEQIIANKTLNKYKELLKTTTAAGVLTEDGIKDLIKQFVQLQVDVGNTKDALDSAGEAQAKLNEHFTKMEMPQGAFAFFETQLKTINDKLANSNNLFEVFKQYEDTFKNFGLGKKFDLAESFGDEKKLKDLGLSAAAGKTIQETLIAQLGIELKNVEIRFAAASKAAREFNTLVSTQDKNFGRLSETGTNLTALTGRKTDLKKRKDEADKAVLAALDTKDPAQIFAANQRANKVTEEQIKNEQEIDRFKVTSAIERAGGGTDAAGLGSIVNTMGATKEGAGLGVFAEDSGAKTSEKFAALTEAMKPALENIASLGPDGPLISAAIEGAMVMSESLTNAFEVIGEQGLKTNEGISAGLQAVGAGIGALNSIQNAQSKRRVAAIDKEIAAEQKRDGNSKQSLDKIRALEKKKESMERKAFERNKKMSMAQIAISTAVSVMGIWSGVKDPVIGPNLATAASALVIGLGAAQLAAVASTSYEGGGSVTDAGGKASEVSVGNRTNTVDLARSRSAVGELGYMRGQSGMGDAENFRPAFTGARYRAVGGSTGFIVGEQGPELFMPDTPGTIVPADDTATAGGGTTTLNFNIQAMDGSDVQRVLSGQTGNIIRMIREQANDAGESFLEELDERY